MLFRNVEPQRQYAGFLGGSNTVRNTGNEIGRLTRAWRKLPTPVKVVGGMAASDIAVGGVSGYLGASAIDKKHKKREAAAAHALGYGYAVPNKINELSHIPTLGGMGLMLVSPHFKNWRKLLKIGAISTASGLAMKGAAGTVRRNEHYGMASGIRAKLGRGFGSIHGGYKRIRPMIGRKSVILAASAAAGAGVGIAAQHEDNGDAPHNVQELMSDPRVQHLRERMESVIPGRSQQYGVPPKVLKSVWGGTKRVSALAAKPINTARAVV